MEEFKKRLLQEEVDLHEKIIKLEKFINSPEFDTLDPLEKNLLKIQLPAMITYHTCLIYRIEPD